MKPERNELGDLLGGNPVPERDSDYWETFPRMVTANLQLERSIVRPTPRKIPLWAFGVAAATVVVVVALAARFWTVPRSTVPGDAALVKLTTEVTRLFPGRVEAIVSDRNGIRLSLAEKPASSRVQPLLLKVRENGGWSWIVTFSGEQVRIRDEAYEVLCDLRGDILLVGQHSYWSSADPERKSHLQVRARRLGITL